jgi:anti-sigma regulatory factor (Ser/Thr protein kinase)
VAPPLGAFGFKRCPEHELQLAPCETLLLYTDGLVERPRIPLRQSLAELIDSVAGARSPEDACLLSMDRLVPHRGPRDDVAVIAVQSDPIPVVFDLDLPADPAMLVRLRHVLTRWLRTQKLERELQAEILIAVSEACANAVEHAYGPSCGRFKVKAERVDEAIEVTVLDEGRWRAPRGDNRGRGLKIMEAAMDSLDVRTEDGGTKIVMRRELRPT